MLRALFLAAALMLPVAMSVGCGNSADKKVDAGNAKLVELNSIHNSLMDQGIIIQYKTTKESEAKYRTSLRLNSMTAAQKEIVKKLLIKYIRVGNEVLAIINSGDDIRYDGDYSQLTGWIRYAKQVLKQLEDE